MSGTGGKGLGRGLSALIPQAADEAHERLTGRDRLFADIVHTGFDLLEELAPLAVCAYVHLPDDDEAELYLRTPRPDSLTPTGAYRLFARFAGVSEGDEGDGPFHAGQRRGRYRRSVGPASQGVHFVVPETDRLDATTWAALDDTAAAFGRLGQQFAVADGRDLPQPRLLVEVENGKTTVEASYDDGRVLRQGRESADDALEAVAAAMLAAAGHDDATAAVSELELDDERAVLVTLTTRDASPRLGLAITAENVLQTTAVATLRALNP